MENQTPSQHSRGQKASGERTCIYNQASSPQRKSSLYTVQLKRASWQLQRVFKTEAGSGVCEEAVPSLPARGPPCGHSR